MTVPIYEDATGQTLDVGDVVVYSVSGGNGGANNLAFGKITALRPKNIKIQPLNADLTIKQYEQVDIIPTGEIQHFSWGDRKVTERIRTGIYHNVDEEYIMSPRKGRFFKIN